MKVSLSAVSMLGDLLQEQQQRIEDACPECDEQLQADLRSVAELWDLYQSLMD